MNTKNNKNIHSVWDVYFNLADSKQKITSANTARTQIPRTLKFIKDNNFIEKGNKLLDIGCGKGNHLFKSEIENIGLQYFGCDPFNQSESTNLHSIMNCMNGQTDILTLNNVLNTVNEKDIRENILKQCKNAINPDTGIVLILTYEGSKLASEKKQEKETGIKIEKLMPIKTRDGWQNRMKTEEYISEVKSVFQNVTLIKYSGFKLIIASVNNATYFNFKK